MIRKDFDINDETYENDTKPFYENISQYIKNHIYYEYISYFLAKKFYMNAMWEGSLEQHIHSATDCLCDIDLFEADVKILNKKLNKFALEITTTNPLQFKIK